MKRIPTGPKRRGYSDTEAKLVLQLTLQPVAVDISSHDKLARRWVPWICCYTGARIGEIARLRKEDVKVDDGISLLHIAYEVGSLKNRYSRYVAVHSHLVEQGFLEFVSSAEPGPLFYDPELAKVGGDQPRVGERLSAWIRHNGITDRSLAPNGAWRHRFKDKCRSGHVDPETLDYMLGRVRRNEAPSIRMFFRPGELRSEIDKVPRVQL